jgi:hypothetical protein
LSLEKNKIKENNYNKTTTTTTKEKDLASLLSVLGVLCRLEGREMSPPLTQ